MDLYLGNLSPDTTEADVRRWLEAFGEVDSLRLRHEDAEGRPAGFAFATMPDEDAARDAVESLNGRHLAGRTIAVNEARPRPQRGGGHDAPGGTAPAG